MGRYLRRILLTLLVQLTLFGASWLSAQVTMPLTSTDQAQPRFRKEAFGALRARVEKQATGLRALAQAKRDSIATVSMSTMADRRAVQERLSRDADRLDRRAIRKDSSAARLVRLSHFYTAHVKFFPVPLNSSESARCFWGRNTAGDGLSLLSGFSLSAGDQRGALAVEAASDFLYGVRTNVSTVVSETATADSIEQNIQRFLTGGGNGVIGFAYPLFHAASEFPSCTPPDQGDDPDAPASEDAPKPKKSALSFIGILAPRLGVDIPGLGAAKKDVDYSIDVGFQSRLIVSGADGNLNLMAESRLAVVPFGSRQFYDGIGRAKNADGKTAGAFGYMRMTLGVQVRDQIMLTYSFPVFAPKELKDNFKGFLSVSIVRKAKPPASEAGADEP